MQNCMYVKIIAKTSDSKANNSTVLIPSKIYHDSISPVKGVLKFGLKEKTVDIIPVTDFEEFKSKELSLNFKIDDDFNNTIILSQDIIEELFIPEGIYLCIKFEENSISLGPVVGIFINNRAFSDIAKGYAGIKIMHIVKAAKAAHAFAYFFTADNINLSEYSAIGVIYNHENRRFEKKQVPLPDVLYDRGGGFSSKYYKEAMELRKKLSKFKELKKINAQHYFDKWDLHYRLSSHDNMKEYLPQTMLYEGINTLKLMISRYDTIYLKSCNGSNGRQVMRVRKLGPRLYVYDYYKHKVIREKTDSLNDIADAAKRLMHNDDFIVQEGIDTLTYKGNKVDLRALIQKSSEGKWLVTSIPVRIAVNDCPVTSTKSGSNVYSFDEAFKHILKFSPSQINKIKKEIYKLLSNAADTIQKEYGDFGEIGIDIAIDNDLKAWFIESNSKPAKDTILKSSTEKDIQKAYQRPFEYSKYLAGFIQ